MFSHFQNINFLRAICDWFLWILRVSSDNVHLCNGLYSNILNEDGPSDWQPKKMPMPKTIEKYVYVQSDIWRLRKSSTRPSALGMSDPIWGPLIHIFVDEKKIEKDKDLDQVNCEYTALRFLNF